MHERGVRQHPQVAPGHGFVQVRGLAEGAGAREQRGDPRGRDAALDGRGAAQRAGGADEGRRQEHLHGHAHRGARRYAAEPARHQHQGSAPGRQQRYRRRVPHGGRARHGRPGPRQGPHLPPLLPRHTRAVCRGWTGEHQHTCGRIWGGRHHPAVHGGGDRRDLQHEGGQAALREAGEEHCAGGVRARRDQEGYSSHAVWRSAQADHRGHLSER
mmetsp:Transcript_13087/g.52205  ORF Transcript_13087/g.52205 Transcript_13087/m.52205 type:complete len:214 (+) Transcript_13087:216-857(+)